MQQKQTALAKQARRDLAQLLEQGKEESAKIRVENIIREDIFVEMLEILELYCELLLARFGLLEQMCCLQKTFAHSVEKNVIPVWKKPSRLSFTRLLGRSLKSYKKYEPS